MQLDVYLAVEDLDQSVEFYSEVFGSPPVARTVNYVGFAVGASRFGLMAAAGYAVPVQRGNRAVPTIKVDCLDEWHGRMKALAPKTTNIIDKGPIRLFMFLDPDGNVLEVAGS